MEISNEQLALILGRMEGKLDAQVESSLRQEGALANLDKKLSDRADAHEGRIRALEISNPQQIGETMDDHEKRIRALEHGSAKAGMIGGLGAGIGTAVIIEWLKRKIGM